MASPDDKTQVSAVGDSQKDANLDCLWVFTSGILVGVFLAVVVVLAAIVLASMHPELQSLN